MEKQTDFGERFNAWYAKQDFSKPEINEPDDYFDRSERSELAIKGGCLLLAASIVLGLVIYVFCRIL